MEHKLAGTQVTHSGFVGVWTCSCGRTGKATTQFPSTVNVEQLARKLQRKHARNAGK